MTGQQVVVLGAGHGTRMGMPKIFVRFEGRTFLERILTRCRETAHPVTLVIDPQFRERAIELLREMSLPGLSFREADTGGGGRPRLVEADGKAPMMASVKAALRAGDCGGGFWCWPVDAPFLSAPGWVMAVEAVEGLPDVIWKPSQGGHSGHPVWFPAWAVPRIVEGGWPNGLLGLQEECADRIHTLELEGEQLGDFNTGEQLAAYGGSGEETV